ncbi:MULTISPECIES: HNH endonuclease signature motif containing protein [unclassified Microbispora]|uniref:HNH endonuclease signature motif containing protein n=1 Tax=unclassified Microbispora TaxID=2614687 RepID=UPI00143ADC59|nr:MULTISPECIES: HNH endonuclease signature motif containing protein [unclassified Microbispora]NJP26014.1 DUF222 domain-containing protein [Microbispora sp. CL1-1]
MTANSPLWSSDGSSAHEPFPIIGFEPPQRASRAEDEGDTGADGDADSSTSDDAPGAGQGKGRSSWVVVGSVRELTQELALTPLPDDVDTCLAEAEELLFARDRITSALADRVGRVHRAGQARQHGHASTRCWLRTSGGMTVGGAGRLLTLGAELPRLPVVREKFAAGDLAAGVVEAICAAVAGLSDEQAALAEPILVELAGKAGAAEVAKAGRHLRAVLDPDGEERDEQADYGRRFLRVRTSKGGGVEGEFYLPREAGARLMALLQAYAKKRAQGDDRPLTVRQADALIALLEQKIATELLVVVSAESLPTDPDNTDTSDSAPDDDADPAADLADGEADDTVSDPMSGPGHASGADDPDDFDAAQADDTSGYAPNETGSTEDPSQGDDTVSGEMGGHDDAGGSDAPDGSDEFDTAEAAPATAPAADSAIDPAPGSTDATTGLRDKESREYGVGEREAGGRRPGECEARDRRPSERELRDTASTASADCDIAPSEAARPDPPPEDASPRHTHAGPRPAGDCRHGQGTCPCDGQARCSGATQAPGAPGPSGTAPGGPGPEPETPPGRASGTAPGAGRGTPETAQGATQGASPGAAPGASAGVLPGALLGPALVASLGASLGASVGMAPGLLPATGQVLPVSSVHRLARTSTLVRIVMNAEGQVLDMGRKVRLATPAQRRAVYARYATCWIDGCPLPATMCQIDHADNWSSGGLTDLKLLGPACQFHNRDRYQHPERYTRRNVGTDRWAFTYHRLGTARRLRE